MTPGRPWWRTRRGIVAATTVGALGLAACASHGATTPTSGATVSTGSSSTSTTTTTSIPVGVACAARELVTSVVGSQGAAGTFELTFGLRNTSSAPCPMVGFPGAQLLDSSGTELPTHVVIGGSYQFTDFAPAPVELTAGATAYFNLAYSDVPTGSESTCPTATQIEVTPPHAMDHDVVAINAVVCAAGTVTVSPVFSQSSPQVQTTAPAQS